MTQPRPDLPQSPAACLDQRLADDPSSPLITYYDTTTGERTEVSTVTFANWVAKAANLMRDGLGLPDRPRAIIELRPHWQTWAVTHAVWAMGGSITLAGDVDEQYDVAFTSLDRCASASSLADEVVVLALATMALPGDPVPPPALDFDREARGFGDRFVGPRVDPHTPAWHLSDERALTHVEVVEYARSLATDASTNTGVQRIAIAAERWPNGAAALGALIALASGAGVVLSPTALADDLLNQEQAAQWEPIAEAP
jgi:uncharacterized protein (TIGR03089 family)